MKDLLKSINWRYLIKHEVIVIIAIAFMYSVSNKKYPEKIEYAILLFILWTLLVLISVFYTYYLKKDVTKQKDSTYKSKKENNEHR